MRQQAQELVGFAALRDENGDVVVARRSRDRRGRCRRGEGRLAGVPVDVSVAAILRPISPDLPTPATITRPVRFGDQPHRARELVAQPRLERRQRLALQAQDAAPALDDLVVGHARASRLRDGERAST